MPITVRGEFRSLVIVNPHDRDWTKHRYILWFGACGPTYLMVWANSLDDALDECIDHCEEHAPGLLCEEEVQEAYRDAIARGLSEDEAYERAEVDTTSGGNAGLHVRSDDWGIHSENPSRATILALLGR
jgi:hypothetical protein